MIPADLRAQAKQYIADRRRAYRTLRKLLHALDTETYPDAKTLRSATIHIHAYAHGEDHNLMAAIVREVNERETVRRLERDVNREPPFPAQPAPAIRLVTIEDGAIAPGDDMGEFSQLPPGTADA